MHENPSSPRARAREGKPRLTSITTAPGIRENEALALAASLERSSEHPLAAAIIAGAKDRGIEIPKALDFASIAAIGVADPIKPTTAALRLRSQRID